MAALPFLGDIDLTSHQLQNVLLQLVGADGTMAEGQIKYRTDLHRARVHDGTSVRSLAFLDELAGAITVSDTATIDLTLSTGNISGIVVAGSIGNTQLAQMPTLTLKGNNTGGTAAPVDLTASQAKTLLAIQTTDISNFNTAVTAFRLDQFAAPNTSVSAGSQKITNLANGTSSNDAINLSQLQAAIEGRQWKDPVATTATSALPNSPTYSAGAGTLTAGSNAALAAQNGHTLAAGERVLVQGQASTFQNGIYDVTAVGSGAAPWVLTRSVDASTAAELSNATVMVEANDSTLRGKIYTQQNTLADLTAAAQNWTVTGDNNVYTASTGLTLSGGAFSISAGGVTGTELNASVAGNGLTGGGGSALAVNTGTGLEISSDAVRIATGAAGNGLTGGGGVALAVNPGNGILADGTSTRVDPSVVTRKFSASVGDGSTTNIGVTHSLGTKDVEVEVRRNSDDVKVMVPWTSTSTTVVTLNFDTAPASNAYRVTVLG